MFSSRFLQERKEKLPKKSEFKEVLEADVVFGEYDVIAKMTTDDLGKLQDFVSDKIRAVPNILVTSTMIISQEYLGKCNRPKNK